MKTAIVLSLFLMAITSVMAAEKYYDPNKLHIYDGMESLPNGPALIYFGDGPEDWRTNTVSAQEPSKAQDLISQAMARGKWICLDDTKNPTFFITDKSLDSPPNGPDTGSIQKQLKACKAQLDMASQILSGTNPTDDRVKKLITDLQSVGSAPTGNPNSAAGQ